MTWEILWTVQVSDTVDPQLHIQGTGKTPAEAMENARRYAQDKAGYFAELHSVVNRELQAQERDA